MAGLVEVFGCKMIGDKSYLKCSEHLIGAAHMYVGSVKG